MRGMNDYGRAASGAKRPFICKRDLVVDNEEWKTIQFPTGKEIANLVSRLRRGQGARQGAFAEYWIWNENTPFRLN